MKKIILFLFGLLVWAAQLPAATTFYGIELGLPLEEFESQLLEKGFARFSVSDDDDERIQIRYVSKNKGVWGEEVYVICYKPLDKVYVVTTYREKFFKWKQLKADYQKACKQLTKIYGEPAFTSQDFTAPYRDGDGREMEAVTNEAVDFQSFYMANDNNTFVKVSISKFGQVSISLMDTKTFRMVQDHREAAANRPVIEDVGPEPQHMTCMDVEIDGSIMDVAQALSEEGLKIIRVSDTNGALEGSYEGFDNCRFFVIPNKEGVVYRVNVALPTQTTWAGLVSDYQQLRSILTKQYGEPSYSRYVFDEPYADGDGREMEALDKDAVHVSMRFNTPKGNVFLFISKLKYVCVSFTDDANK